MSKEKFEEILQEIKEKRRKRALECAKRNKMLDLTLDPVQKRKLGITPRRTFE